MGKKHIIQKSQEEIIKEEEQLQKNFNKGIETTVATVEKSRDGKIYIFSSYNNTIITLTNSRGDVLSWTSAGKIGFKGAKKATPYAASKVAEAIAQIAQKLGVTKVAIFVRGVGSGRESAVRSLATHGVDIMSIKDITPIPHNGCRPPKVRRV